MTDLNFLGYQITPEAWQQFTVDSLAYCQNFDIVAVCGSLPRGVSPELFADWQSVTSSWCESRMR